MGSPPSRGGVSSAFGMRINPNDGVYRMHYGEDTLGTGNYATATGTVVFAGYDKTGTGLGWAVGIREAANPSVIWWVGHHGTSSLWNPLKVKVGSKVSERFTYLGPKGNTGAAKGVHAHTERRVNGAARPGSGTATNPRSYYTGGAGGGGAPIPIPEPTYRQREDTDMLQAYIPGTNGQDHTFIHYGPGFYWEFQDTVPRGIATQALGQITGLPLEDINKGAASSIKVTRAQADSIRAASLAAPVDVEGLAAAIVAQLPAGTLTKQDVVDVVADIKFPTYGPVA